MSIDIYMKSHEESLNGFQVIKQTRFCDRQTKFQGMSIDIYMKSHEESLNGFQVIKQTRFCDRQTKFQGKQLKKYKCNSYGSCAHVTCHLMLTDIYHM